MRSEEPNEERDMQDDLRYAIQELLEPLDIGLGYEEVCLLSSHTSQNNRDVGRYTTHRTPS